MLEVAAAAKTAADQVEALQHQIDALHGTEVTIKVNTEGSLGGLGTAGLDAGFDAMRRDIADMSADLMMQTQLLRDMAPAWQAIQQDIADSSADLMMQTQLMREDAGSITLVANAADRSRGSLAAAGAAGAAAAGGWRIFGMAAGQVLHWVVAAGAEFLAVAIPASVALGAAMLVAAQGAQMVQQHMSALYTATEATANMFHVTIGSALGLHSALQQAQNAANPVVWSVLGGVINIVKSNFQGLAGQGLDVMRVFQTFTARVVADFQQGFGTQIHGLLAGMVTDLTMFGQILGNVGHALISFAAAMPGLAEVLLTIVDGASQVLRWVSQLPPVLITVAMAMEETWRWGGALAAILTRVPALLIGFVASGLGVIPVLTRVGAIFQSLLLIVPRLGEALGMGLVALGRWIPALDEAGGALVVFSRGAVAAVTGMSALGAGLTGAVIGGFAFLIYEGLTAKSAIQQMADSMQHTVDIAKGMAVFSDIASNIGVLNTKLAENAAWSQRAANSTAAYQAAGARSVGIAAAAAQNAGQYNTALRQQQQDLLNATQAVTFLSHTYGVSFVGALELGTQAGVQWDQGIGKMSVAADINRLKVMNLLAGYKAMGQSAGQVGKDMTVIGLESALQATKIGTLTQAWQSYMGQLTGGTTGLATFEQGLANIGTVASSTAGTLFEATGKMNQSTQNFAESLRGFTGKAAQNWQNFNQVVTTGAQGFITWMQTAGAMGVVSGNQMDNAIKGIVAQMIPFAAHSEAARAELAGLALQANQVVPPTTKALEAFAKGGDSAKQLARFVQEATGRMGDMAKVAQNLGDVLQSDLVSMFDKAKLAASGLPGDLSNLANAIHATGAQSSTTHGDMIKVISDLLSLHTSVPVITALLNTMGIHISQTGVAALIAAGHLGTLNGAAHTAANGMNTAAGRAQILAWWLGQLKSKTITVTTVYQSVGVAGFGGHTGLGPRQHGGPVEAARAYLVGEAGPELFIPHVSGQVLSNPVSEHLLSSPAPAAAAGGAPINLTADQHIHVHLDGRELFKDTQRKSWQWSVRNTGKPGSWTPS